jgi:RHS repeat-associated protein
MGWLSIRSVLSAWIGAVASIVVAQAAASDLATAVPAAGLKLSPKPSEAELRTARGFSEPLVPVGAKPSAAENRQLAQALEAYAQRPTRDDFSALEQFIADNPNSSWTPALWFELAGEYYRTGWYSKSLDAWRTAWPLLKNESEPAAKALGDRAAAELAYMLARLGRMAELDALLTEVKNRVFIGSANEKIAGAQEGLWTMKNRPQIAFKCGPYALGRILASQDPLKGVNPLIRNAASTTNGCSLVQVADLSRQLGMNFQMAYRSNGAALIMPAVVNWKVGHYAALLRQQDGLNLLQDPTFGNDTWVSARALNAETSGYFLVPAGNLPAGWRPVTTDEGANVFGKGQTTSKDNTATTPADLCNCKNGNASYFSLRGVFQWVSYLIGHAETDRSDEPQAYGSIGIRGMVDSAVQLSVVGLNLRDNPVGYTPPLGPPVQFIATYNQRDAEQPANFSYSNLGYQWTFNWLAYINDDPSSPPADVSFYTDGGGALDFTGFNSTNQTYAPQVKTQAQLIRTSTNSYQMVLPDGSQMIFALPGSVGGTSRQVFMTQEIDPEGNAVQISYDGSYRVTAITDAIGQVTTFAYGNTNDTLEITQVTDPFGRFATFTYDSSNRLSSITDTMGITSQFTYNAGDFIQALTTPYGTTTFQTGGTEPQRWLVTTYPDGEQDRVEFLESSVIGIPMQDPTSTLPAGMAITDDYLIYRNTFYWDRNAYARAPTDYTQAKLYHWLHLGATEISSSVLESEQAPLENRIWYTYAGQPSSIMVGTSDQPSAVGRVLDDGTTQLRTFQYNSLGHVTNAVDPLGRNVTSIYSTNLVDLLALYQTTGTNNDLLARFLYNTQHLAVATWDPAGQMTTNTYNARGEMLTTSDPAGETTSFSYDTNGYLLSVTGPLPGPNDTVSFTYDSVGRVRTYTDQDGYSVTNSYDNLDRLTNITYPDGTFMAVTYSNLDRVKVQDRLGRITQYTYDALRRLVAIQDPLNRVTAFQYCGCGGLSAAIDPMGRPTQWTYDIEGRPTSKQYADGSSEQYTYENTTSRVKSMENEKGEVKTFTYALDDNVSGITYSVVQTPTPSVSFTYDPNYNRLVAMQDGIGTTTYAYNPVGTIGALKVASATGPWPNETVTYQYDELQRLTNRTVDGVAESYAYDALGRTTNVVNALGNFGYDFDGATARLLDAYYPNGQSTHYTYYGNLGDRRLQSITDVGPASAPISSFTYAYNAVGQITNWVQQQAGLTNNWNPVYDPADQLLGVQAGPGGATTNYTYGYDAAGNRLFETILATNVSQYNELNQLVASSDAALTNATYQWDAEGRLVAINTGTATSEFTYDGLNRRSDILQLTNGVIASERRYVWCGVELCEERNASNSVLRRFYQQGFTVGPTNYFYTRDHLESVREVLDGNGVVQSRYGYDPFGRQNVLQGNEPAPFTYAGYFLHAPSGLKLATERFFSSELGRWLSRDPLGEQEGVNLYAYVENNPLNQDDPSGLCLAELVAAVGNDVKQAYHSVRLTVADWYYRNIYDKKVHYEAELERWWEEHKFESAEKTAETAEYAGQIIKGEPSAVPVVGITAAVSKDPPALINGITQAVSESSQLDDAINLVNANGAAVPTPSVDAAQRIGQAVRH